MHKPQKTPALATTLAALLALGGAAGAEETSSVQTTPALDKLRAYITEQAIDTKQTGWRTRLPKFPALEFETGHTYFIEFDTSKGPLKIGLFTDTAPQHAANFLYLTSLGFFDGLTFHRVIPGFMAQGGCPVGDGRGSPGFRFPGEYEGGLKHDSRGLLSMANAGPGTDGSQFFITFQATPWLDGKHTLFGKVVSGGETLTALEKCGTPGGQTTEKLLINKATLSVTVAAKP